MSKASKHLRECPAAERAITSRECGEGRQFTIRCAAECAYNPFSAENYDEFGEIEARVIRKTIDYFVRENRGDNALMENYRSALDRGIGDSTAFCLWHCFWRRDDQGKTMAERWDAKRLDGLGNDERTVFAGHRRVRPSLVEVRRVVDDRCVEGLDLFTGMRITIADRTLAANAARFDTMFVWLAPLPHFYRILGVAPILPAIHSLSGLEVLRAISRHLGAPEDLDAETHWLAERWRDVARALDHTRDALRHATFTAVDAKYYTTDYRLKTGPNVLRSRLAKRVDILHETPSQEDQSNGFTDEFSWFEPDLEADPAQPELPSLSRLGDALPGRRVIGRVLLSSETARIEASAAARNAVLRPRFEQLAGNTVEFRAERVDDIPARVVGKANFDASLVPPRLLERAPRIEFSTSRVLKPQADDMQITEADLKRRYAERWPDEPIPALDGRTPREAAAIPALRTRLIDLVKGIVQKEDRESFDASDRATQLILMLGLDEIAEPTPPMRPNLYKDGEDAGADFAIDDPPRDSMTDSDVEMRVNEFVTTYPITDAQRLTDDFETLAGDLLDSFEALLEPLLKEFECDVLYLSLTRLYFVMVPGATERTDMDPVRFAARMKWWLPRFVEALEATFEDSEALFEPFDECRQPLVAVDAATTLLRMEGKSRKEHTRPEVMPMVLAFIASATDELDCTVIEAR